MEQRSTELRTASDSGIYSSSSSSRELHSSVYKSQTDECFAFITFIKPHNKNYKNWQMHPFRLH
jgi:hypothetical protein